MPETLCVAGDDAAGKRPGHADEAQVGAAHLDDVEEPISLQRVWVVHVVEARRSMVNSLQLSNGRRP
ncbi:hypothetical protein ACGFZH_36165 [Streptomyces zaomyceticus]|uniref:hypothetical protein n=1 Tax=Streptomyces zaomyceticus TaxID=68286 RepID=UPI003722D251